MSAFLAVAWNGFREATRNRVTLVAGAFALVLLFSTSLVQEATVSTMARVVTDFGLGAMAMMLGPLAIYLSCGLIPREIERRTVFLIVTRPISRASFLWARIVGNMLTLGSLLLLMVAAFGAELLLTMTPPTWSMTAAVGGLYVELLVITCVGMLFSSMSSQLVSGIITVGVYFVGHFSGDIYGLATHSNSTGLKVLGRAVYFALPNLERLNFRSMATYALPVSLADFMSAVASGVGYSVLFALGAAAIFERRDFK